MAICVDIVPTPCGGTNKLTMKDACNDVHFTGIEDTTINQGVGIDLTEGIHAYDGNGNEIEYTVTPDSIDKCDVGEHTVVYRTIGEGDKFLPSFCMDNVDVTLGDTFCNEILLEEDRIVTITQADPPTIEGIETIPTIYPNEEFDPTEGITATDDNGKTIDFTYSGRVEDSSEGAIASFETEFEQDALSVVADIEPVQSFNGYDHPWVGGAGKNKLQNNVTTKTINGITFTVNADGTVMANGTATADAQLAIALDTSKLNGDLYFVGSNGAAENVANAYMWDNTAGARCKKWDGTSVTATSFNGTLQQVKVVQGNNVRLTLRVMNGKTVSNHKFIPMIVASSVSDATYEPYSNICPISGRTEVVTQRTGKNLIPFPFRDGDMTRAGVTWTMNSDGTLNAHGTASSTTYYGMYGINTTSLAILVPLASLGLQGGDTVTLSSNYSQYVTVQCNKEDGTLVATGLALDGGGSVTKTLPTTAKYIYIGLRVLKGETVNQDNIFVQLEKGSTATDYEPYNGNTYTTALGRTVYGGTLDVVSGELVVDRAMVTIDGSKNWTKSDTSQATADLGLIRLWTVVNGAGRNRTLNISNQLPTYTRDSWNVNEQSILRSEILDRIEVAVFTSQYADATAWKNHLADNPLQVCYELAEPQRYPLTPQEVELLLGENNIWADTGDIKVIYEKEMPASGNIEYLTAGLKIITYTATDECGNQTVEQRIVYVLGDTPQVCMAEVGTAHVACEDNQ